MSPCSSLLTPHSSRFIMACEIFPINGQGIQKSARIILQGGVVAFPTETFYGLAADALSEKALVKIFRIKEREDNKPLLLLVPDRSWVAGLVESIPLEAERLMEKFWPGPLTLVFQARAQISVMLTGNTGKVGVRVSSHPVANSLVRAVGRAITATSANVSGQPSLCTAREVFHSLGEKLDGILDGGETAGGLGSTVLDISGPDPKMIREGMIRRSELIKEVKR